MTHPSSTDTPRGIDHLVVAASNLDHLAESYRKLGFQVGPRNRHPWGTENHIVQFPGCFLELIGVGDAKAIPPQAKRHFSFGAFIANFIKGGDGAAMLALESRNAVADQEAFRRARIGDFEPSSFERQGAGPDGQPRRVSFSLAFAEMQNEPRAGFFVCQQHQPHNFWDAARQVHPNGVETISTIVLVAEDPSDYHEFLGHVVDQRVMRATSYGLELDTGRGLIEVLSPEAFSYRFGQPAPGRQGQHLSFAAATFRIRDPKAAQPFLAAAGAKGGLVPADRAGGIVLSFAAT